MTTNSCTHTTDGTICDTCMGRKSMEAQAKAVLDAWLDLHPRTLRKLPDPFAIIPVIATALTEAQRQLREELRREQGEGMIITLPARIHELIQQHGGLRPAARALGLDAAYLSRLKSCEKYKPSAATLKKLGLLRVTTIHYVTIDPSGKG